MRNPLIPLFVGCTTLLFAVLPMAANACPLSGSGGSCAGSVLFGPTTLGVGAVAVGLGLVFGIITAKRAIKR
jgi:hypothetical protein